MESSEGLCPVFTQDSHRIDHGIDALQFRDPVGRSRVVLKIRVDWRMAASGNDNVTVAGQHGPEMAADETGSTGQQNTHAVKENEG